MNAKTELLERIKYLNVAISYPVVINSAVGASDHNGAANLLRKGLGIVAFNILEDFIKAKIFEALDSLSNSGISYSDLSDKLKEASTLGALKALFYRATLEKKGGGDWISLIQSESTKISSTINNTDFSLSKLSFANDAANVGADEVSAILKAFGISGGWKKLKDISDAISGGVPDLNQSYKNAADRRHKAAHNTNFEYEYAWLNNIEAEIMSIAASIDIVLTAICRLVTAKPSKKLDQHDITYALKYKFLCLESGVYKQKNAITAKSVKNWGTLEDAIAHLEPRLVSKNEFLIVLNAAGRISNWYC
jgi:hypothetical protein